MFYLSIDGSRTITSKELGCRNKLCKVGPSKIHPPVLRVKAPYSVGVGIDDRIQFLGDFQIYIHEEIVQCSRIILYLCLFIPAL